MESGILETISIIINNEIAFVLMISAIVFFFEKNGDKRKKIILSLFFAVLLGIVLKQTIGQERPCNHSTGLIECPFDNSMPSIHSITAFTLAIAFLDKREYLLVLVFAAIVGWSRIFLGVHTFYDVMASLALSPVCYGLVDYYWRKRNE